jgi:branched-chain amino acid transport system permease protein
MISFKDLKKGFLVALWFIFLTFPIMVIKVNPFERTIAWRWHNMFYVAAGSFFLYLAGRFFLLNKAAKQERQKRLGIKEKPKTDWQQRLLTEPKLFVPTLAVVLLGLMFFPHILSTYQVNIMITALMYIVLGLGLNIVVGVAGLLDLGYVAFYAVGAYSYALLHLHFGLGFWTVLPLGGILAATFGIMLGFPVLRLRGDYLAIVTLGFGEIIRLILENWNDFSHGPSGISNIPRPGFLAWK